MSRSSEFSVPRWRRSPARPSSRPPFARPTGARPVWSSPDLGRTSVAASGGSTRPWGGWRWKRRPFFRMGLGIQSDGVSQQSAFG